jgi:fructosamine-3-kinase
MVQNSQYRKSRLGAPKGFFRAEAAGLKWLEVAGGPRVVRVLDFGDDYLDLEMIPTVNPTHQAAYEFGAQLATLHSAPVSQFGISPAPNWYFGPLSDPIALPIAPTDDYVRYWYELRMLPLLEEGVRRGRFTQNDISQTAEVAKLLQTYCTSGAMQVAPSKVHGDLWHGNVLWSRTIEQAQLTSDADEVQCVLIDPSAHSGHCEEDLAMLELFSCPFFDAVLDGYNSIRQLHSGYRERFDLHNLFPIAGHVVFFGGSYYSQYQQMLKNVMKLLNF